VLLALEGAFDTPTSTGAPVLQARTSIWKRVMPIGGRDDRRGSDWSLHGPDALWGHGRRSHDSTSSSLQPGAARFQRSVVRRRARRPRLRLMAIDGLHLRSLADLETRLIPGTAEARRPRFGVGAFAAPFFSPDGQWIGYILPTMH
jgi:hypothetical protein